MKQSSFDRWGSRAAMLGAIAGFAYAVSFVALKNQLLYSLFLTLLGLFAFVALTSVYGRVRDADPSLALLALAFGLFGAAGTAIHGGYDLSNAINPPTAALPAGYADLPSQVDPRGLLTFGFTGVGLFIFAWMMTQVRSFPKNLGYLGLLSAILFVVIYLGRLIVLDPSNALLLVPVLLNGFIVSPIFYFWLGMSLRSGSATQPAALGAAQNA